MSHYDQLRRDWRIGALTYQVFVDRFAPSDSLEQKKHLYQPPKTLKDWSESPVSGELLTNTKYWSHELAFWGGDLMSLKGKIDYIKQLGMDVLYLNPIFKAATNHKYDAQNYFEIAPEYGDLQQLKELVSALQHEGIHLILDGVFNHVSYTSDWFQHAQADDSSPYRDWFRFDPDLPDGYVGWWDVNNLPELNWNNPEVRKTIVTDKDSVVRHYLKAGISGWRLDVASDLGFDHLAQITKVAHQEKQDCLVIGEVWAYPARWCQVMDGVMNFSLRQILFLLVQQQITSRQFSHQLQHMIDDTGLEPLLRSWIILDNHDTARLTHLFPDQKQQQLLQILQFTLPGSPVIYYGVELGMTGGEDPESRGPMRWDLVTDDNPCYTWLRRLITIRNHLPALKIGDYVAIESESTLAFLRITDKVSETCLVVVNCLKETVSEKLMIRDSRIMNREVFIDQLSQQQYSSHCGIVELTLAPLSAVILTPTIWQADNKHTGYTPYKHII